MRTWGKETGQSHEPISISLLSARHLLRFKGGLCYTFSNIFVSLLFSSSLFSFSYNMEVHFFPKLKLKLFSYFCSVDLKNHAASMGNQSGITMKLGKMCWLHNSPYVMLLLNSFGVNACIYWDQKWKVGQYWNIEFKPKSQYPPSLFITHL